MVVFHQVPVASRRPLATTVALAWGSTSCDVHVFVLMTERPAGLTISW